MQAVTFRAPFQLACAEVDEPRVEQPTDAVVAVELAAVCGSDLHVYRGVEVGLDAGTTLGHEFLGRVAAVGSAVQNVRVGDRVVAPFSVHCGACWFCHQGLTSRCAQSQLFGWVERGRGLQGAQAEAVRVPFADRSLVRVPDGTALGPALLVGDVLATGFWAAEHAGIQRGDVVAVLGLGPVGLCAVLGARECGAGAVFAVDSVPERLALAARYGGTPIDRGAQDPLAAVRAATDGRGADVVIEAVGHPDASALAWQLVRCGGAISAPGVHNEKAFALTPGQLYDKNLTYRAGRAPVATLMPRLLARVHRGDFDLEPLFSHRLPLAAAADGYALFDQKQARCTKVLLTLGQG
jgi:threonine dehydrogenase-like Zn-dependent dehydrogenase